MSETITSQGSAEEYKISDIDDAAEPFYYGFLRGDGSWVIMSQENNEFRYSRGDSDYSTAWVGRAGLTYYYYNDSF